MTTYWQFPLPCTELATLLREALVIAIEDEVTATELLVAGVEELERLVVTELALDAVSLSLGFLPTKNRSGAGGVAIPSPIKKLGCGGWL